MGICIELWCTRHMKAGKGKSNLGRVHVFDPVHSIRFSHKHIAVQQNNTVKQTRKRLSHHPIIPNSQAQPADYSLLGS